MLEYDGLKENGGPNVGVYCGIWGGRCRIAGIGLPIGPLVVLSDFFGWFR
jgi:hypothetical protein